MGSKGFYLLVILCGAVIDILQASIGLAIAGITFMGGGALQFIPFVGQILGAGFTGAGAAIGYALSVVFGIGGGAILLTLLAYGGMFYPGAILVTVMGESLPLLNALPGWTALAVRCSYRDWKKQKEEGEATTYDEPAIA